MTNDKNNSQVYIAGASGALGAIVVMLGGFLLYQTGIINLPATNQVIAQTNQPPSQQITTITTEDDKISAVIQDVQPAVVTIAVTKDLPVNQVPQNNGSFNDFFSDPFFDNFFGRNQQSQPDAQEQDQDQNTIKRHIGGGSGFFVSSDGLLVTNKHVVDDEDADYTIITHDGTKYDAKVLAKDPVFDLAYLKVDGSDFKYLEFADSDKLQLGQTVLAIGNALDEFRNTVTKGIVSGLNRHFLAGQGDGTAEVIEQAIQTDAAINPGNSGGPLINLDGKVIGVNTAVSLEGQLIGFSLPSNLVQRGVDQVQSTGKISRAWLGVRYQIITDELVQKNNLKVDHGALILRGADQTELAVIPGSPADKAGLRENDIILEVDGKKIDTDSSLSSQVAGHSPGDTIMLKISRAGEEKQVSVTLEEREQ